MKTFDYYGIQRQLPKLNVVGSIPIARSNLPGDPLIGTVDLDNAGPRRAVAVAGEVVRELVYVVDIEPRDSLGVQAGHRWFKPR